MMNGIARCGNCLYFCPWEKTSVGCRCSNDYMNKRRLKDTESLKQPSSAPCSQYIRDHNKNYIPKLITPARLVRDNSRPASYKFRCTSCGEICYYHTANGKIKECGYNFCPWCGKRNAKENDNEQM